MRLHRLQTNAQRNADQIKARRDILDWALGEKAKLRRLEAEKAEKEAEKEFFGFGDNIGSLSTSASAPNLDRKSSSFGQTSSFCTTGGPGFGNSASLGSLGMVSMSEEGQAPVRTMHSTLRPSCSATVFSRDLTAGKTFTERVDLARSIATRNSEEIQYRRNMLNEKAAKKAREAAMNSPVSRFIRQTTGGAPGMEPLLQEGLMSRAIDTKIFKVASGGRPLPRVYNDMLQGAQTGADTFKLDFSETLSQPVAPGLAATGASLKDRLAHFEQKAMWNSYTMAKHRRDLQYVRNLP